MQEAKYKGLKNGEKEAQKGKKRPQFKLEKGETPPSLVSKGEDEEGAMEGARFTGRGGGHEETSASLFGQANRTRATGFFPRGTMTKRGGETGNVCWGPAEEEGSVLLKAMPILVRGREGPRQRGFITKAGTRKERENRGRSHAATNW